jgi:hypothetical protein
VEIAAADGVEIAKKRSYEFCAGSVAAISGDGEQRAWESARVAPEWIDELVRNHRPIVLKHFLCNRYDSELWKRCLEYLDWFRLGGSPDMAAYRACIETFIVQYEKRAWQEHPTMNPCRCRRTIQI